MLAIAFFGSEAVDETGDYMMHYLTLMIGAMSHLDSLTPTGFQSTSNTCDRD